MGFIRAKQLKTAIDNVDKNTVHITGTEKVTGDKDFTGKVTANTAPEGDVSRTVATTEFCTKTIYGMTDILGVQFDGQHAQGTRILGAVGKNWSKSTDTTAGVDDFKDNAIFAGYDAIVQYNPETGKAEEKAVKGTYEYEQLLANPTADYDIVRMFHKFYYKQEIKADGSKQIQLSAIPREGFLPSPMHYRDGVMHEWVGLTKYHFCYNPLNRSKVCSRGGLIPKVRTPENTFETLARERGLRVMGINEYSALQLLGCVKYASQNWQSAVGKGVAGAELNSTISVAQTDATSIIVPVADAYKMNVGECFLYNDYPYLITSKETVTIDGTEYTKAYFDPDKSHAATLTSAAGTTIYLRQYMEGRTDAIKGVDGEDETAPDWRRPVLTMGIENFYSNVWNLLGGGVRIGTDVYINPSPDTQYAWPGGTSDLKGWKLAAAEGGTTGIGTTSGWVKRFVPTEDLGDFPYLSLTAEVGGANDNPVGDYFYSNTDTTVKMFIAGGSPIDGSFGGPFYWDVDHPVSYAGSVSGARGVFVPGL